MKRAPVQAAFRVLRIGQRVTDQDGRDLSLIELAPYEPAQDSSSAWDGFYDALVDHCAEVVRLHNLKLSTVCGSLQHARLQQQMRNAVRTVVGNAPFKCFGPSFGPMWSKVELPPPDEEPTVQTEATWTCYWLVFAFEMLVEEARDDAAWLVGNYVQAICDWWRLAEAHGSAAVNAAIIARPEAGQ